MGFRGNWDIYTCDKCGCQARVEPGHPIWRYPAYTNQTWEETKDGKTICRDCQREAE